MVRTSFAKIILLILILSIFISAFLFFLNKNKKIQEFTSVTNTTVPLYKGVGEGVRVTVFADNVAQVTDIEITPDGQTLLAATLTGKIYAFQKIDGQWLRQSDLFFDLETFQPGFPPEEAGLTGIVLGADFEKSGDVFLNYSFSPIKKTYKNRVTRINFTKLGKKIIGLNPKLIFEANTDGSPAHQIQDGVGVMIKNSPHILFGIGEGFEAKRALDLTKEAGKLVLIKADGNSPEGTRPYANSKLQAIGLRNPPDLTLSPSGQIALVDTGPDHFDRLIYGRLVDTNGENVKRFNFNWDGTEKSLEKNVANPFGSGNLTLYKWKETETPVALNFLDDKRLLVTLFGKTGSKENKPGKKILLGTITEGLAKKISFKTLVERDGNGEGQLSQPIGTAVDSTTGDIYFGDLMEGRIYKVVIGGEF